MIKRTFQKTKRLVLRNLFYLFPIKKNKIVFNNFNGRGFGGNPKYIALALLKMHKDPLDLVWIAGDQNISVPEGIRVVKKTPLRIAYEMSTAKIWINNIRNSFKPNKKSGQFYIQTWHGTMDIKKVEGQVVDKLSNNYVKSAKLDGKLTDLMLSNGSYTSKRYKQWYWYNGEILESGNPRMDVVITRSEKAVKKVYDTYNLNYEDKIVLYAPTFRETSNEDSNFPIQYTFNYQKITSDLEEKFGHKFKFLVRLHPNISEKTKNLNDSACIDATSYPDMQELLAAADVLITDYSSCMVDFILARKPVFLFAKDYKEYTEAERGFNFDPKELPPAFAQNEMELAENIATFDLKQYSMRCELMMKKLGIYEPGNASQTVADYILKLIVD